MIYDLIATLLDYGEKKNLIKKEDEVYFQNKLIELFHLDECKEGKVLDYSLEELMEAFDDYAYENKMIGETITERDNFDTKVISLLVDRPSNIIKQFYDLYNKDKKAATDYFYQISIDSNYIRKYRCDRDLKWVTPTKYGDIDITVNLSKPEKDPKEIEKAKNMPKGAYPVCLLCKENEGYAGRMNHPARGNIRLIPLTLGGEDFFMQYSPYSYYNEHCILLNKEHKPMIIENLTIRKLLDFVDFLPHYFIGSNADLPIVGGSILAHEHFQGGSYTFAMNKATSLYDFKINGVNASIINWPLSVIRLSGDDKEKLLEAFDTVFNAWLNYSDEEVGIRAYSGEVRHNTITPIARKKDGHYELDLALRNNRTDEAHPLGIFHPHDEYHHIK
nr:UDP-glucose--hexose-1-phosphate uridylyltransferase [Bacilli bacterium]